MHLNAASLFYAVFLINVKHKYVTCQRWEVLLKLALYLFTKFLLVPSQLVAY